MKEINNLGDICYFSRLSRSKKQIKGIFANQFFEYLVFTYQKYLIKLPNIYFDFNFKTPVRNVDAASEEFQLVLKFLQKQDPNVKIQKLESIQNVMTLRKFLIYAKKMSPDWMDHIDWYVNIPRNQSIEEIVQSGKIIPIKTATDLFKEDKVKLYENTSAYVTEDY